ncbi:hypothetical protein FNU76_08070 [Chitinimonas arctica]|uniref:Uncharacterized protein n=1 Tax=Chitinimonas arctica TaxID=2594795 RepID=A0A516SDW3_9NEIS|nr:hypothetical protein [Chitinimonas arctica]QDQ26320.1 hypothetical protein FNU76_08070 [Chitinimonas arctica]
MALLISLLSSAARALGSAKTNAPEPKAEKSAKSAASSTARHTLNTGLFGSWSFTTICSGVLAVHKAIADYVKPVVEVAGSGVGAASCLLGMIEAAESLYDTAVYLGDLKRAVGLKDKHREQAKAFEAASTPRPHRRAVIEGEAAPGVLHDIPVREEEIATSAAESLLGKHRPKDPVANREPIAKTGPSEQAKGAMGYFAYRDAEIEHKELKVGRLSNAIAFLRDGVLQLANIGIGVAGIVKTIADSTAGSAVIHVSTHAAGMVSSAIGVVSGAFQIGQGVADYRDAKHARQVASEFCKRVTNCFDYCARSKQALLSFSMLCDKKDENNDKYENTISNCPAAELSNIQEIYGGIFRCVHENHKEERKSQKTLRTRAKFRIAYGIVGAVISGIGVILTATGVASPIGLGVLSAGGAALGGVWLGYAGYRSWDARKQKRETEKLLKKHKAQLGAVSGNSVCVLEASYEKSSKNGQMAVVLLMDHLSGGRAEMIVKNVNATRQEITAAKQAFATSRLAANPGQNLSAAGLRVRRKTATRALLLAGMSRQDVRALKRLIAEGNQQEEVASRIENFLLGNGGRALWQKPTLESVPAPAF